VPKSKPEKNKNFNSIFRPFAERIPQDDNTATVSMVGVSADNISYTRFGVKIVDSFKLYGGSHLAFTVEKTSPLLCYIAQDTYSVHQINVLQLADIELHQQ
jgi:hypothetical protein